MTTQITGASISNLDVAFASKSTEVSITATTSGTGNTCITTGSFSISNISGPGEGYYYVDVYTPYLTLGTTNLDVELWDGATFVSSLSGHMAAATTRPGGTMTVRVYLGNGNHNLTVKAFVDAGTGKFGAGDGATGDAPNAYIRVRSA